jgi:hypothetical protein
LAPE